MSQDNEWPLLESGYKPEGTRVFLGFDGRARLSAVKVEQVLPAANSGEVLNLSRLLDEVFECYPPMKVGFQVTLKQEIQLSGKGTFVGVRLDSLRKGRVSCLYIEQNVPRIQDGQKLRSLSLVSNLKSELSYHDIVLAGLIGTVESGGKWARQHFDYWTGPLPEDPLGVTVGEF